MKNEGSDAEYIRLAHGGGGRLMRDLVRGLFAAHFADSGAETVLEDAAVIDQTTRGGQIAFTTDTFVVDPLFFPGGNVGDLAVNGTVNDLAMRGAHPLALSVAMIIEEGFPFSPLREIVGSIAAAARVAGVRIVTGDTKVVGRGQVDRLFVNTSGVGVVPPGVNLSAAGLEPGDRIIVSGPIGDHGIAVMSRRGGLSFEADIRSDTAPLADLVRCMVAESKQIHAMRDPTRGGLAAALCELAEDSRVRIELDEKSIPVRPVVRAACETLGFDPLHVPCEGRLVAVVHPDATDIVLTVMRRHPHGKDAAVVGEVRAGERSEVLLRTRVGGKRRVDLPAGELLPRIC
jgi:hydrogenase expression/formation protein HypE